MTKILDKGYLVLKDHMGDDHSIVEAARASIDGEGVKAVSDDRTLIRYLLRHRHTTPFEQQTIKFAVKCPIFVARQWIRHRTMSFNEISARYAEMADEFYVPDLPRCTKQSTNNKQGSATELVEHPQEAQWQLEDAQKNAFDAYKDLLNVDLARETSRIVTPVGAYTKFFVTANLLNWMKFCMLRQDPHAQYEIRVYADAIAKELSSLFPVAMEAYDDYWLHGVQFSKEEMRLVLNWLGASPDAVALEYDLKHSTLSKREQAELKAKLGI